MKLGAAWGVEVRDSQGHTLLEDNLGCDRYGILPSKMKGYHDLVCGLDDVGRWNVKTWVFPECF